MRRLINWWWAAGEDAYGETIRFVMLIFFVVIIFVGVMALLHEVFEKHPQCLNEHVGVITDWKGRYERDMERAEFIFYCDGE